MKLGILSTHPIQYNAPLFRMISQDQDITLQVFYSKTGDQTRFDTEFDQDVVWDIDLVSGYSHESHDASTSTGRTQLIESISAFAPDALLVYGWNFPGHFRVMKTFKGPVWFRGDSHLLNPQPVWRRWLRRMVLTRIYRHVDMAFPVGEANVAYFLHSGLMPDQLLRAPHAVDNAKWAADDASRLAKARDWRQELDIPKEDKVVGFAGKFDPIKQVDLLIEAHALHHDDRLHLILAGTGPMEGELKALAQSRPNIHFLGFVNQSKMPIFYRMCDVFVLPSRSETWGLCINEALASGTRCVVTDRVGCGPDILCIQELGTIVPWNDVTALSKALKQEGFAGGVSLPARTAFMEEFSYDAFLSQLKSAWEEIR